MCFATNKCFAQLMKSVLFILLFYIIFLKQTKRSTRGKVFPRPRCWRYESAEEQEAENEARPWRKIVSQKEEEEEKERVIFFVFFINFFPYTTNTHMRMPRIHVCS